MTRRTTPRSAVDSDGTSTAIAAQQRIFQLKKERDEKIKDVVAKVMADLDEIRHQASREREEHEQRRRQKKERILSEIAKSVQRRNAIEEEMMAVVSGIGAAMTQIEDCVMEVYDGKECEMQQLLQDEQV